VNVPIGPIFTWFLSAIESIRPLINTWNPKGQHSGVKLQHGGFHEESN
jgi:hypothetical protein